MNLEQQLRTYGDRVEAHAVSLAEPSEPPDSPPPELDRPSGPARPGRTRLLVLAAALVVLVVGIAAVVTRDTRNQRSLELVGPGQVAPNPDPAPSGPMPPTEPDGPISLWLSATRVPPGPVDLVAVLVNHDGTDAMFGVGGQVERWDGEAWVPHRQVSLCLDGWNCTAHLAPIDEMVLIPDIGLSATIEQPGPVERFTTDGLEDGWYRLTQTANEGIVAAATFEVADDASPPAPLSPLDQPATSVSPAFVGQEGAMVRLSPTLPGVGNVADMEQVVAGWSEIAVVERWDGGAWTEVVHLPLAPVSAPGAAMDRTAALPPLEPGSYQLVRASPSGQVVGSFWVIGADPAPVDDRTDTVEPTDTSVMTATTADPAPVDPSVAVEPERTPWAAGAGEEARIDGVLTISPDGCTAVGGLRAAWPAGTVIEGDGTQLRLTDGTIFVAGTRFAFRGGHHRSSELPVPDRCPGDEVVFVW